MKTDFSCCCSSLIPSQDTARCYLLFVLIAFYMLAGAAIFSSLERPAELQAHQLWEKRLRDFGHEHNITHEDLKTLLLHYEEARTAGIRTEPGRALWDIPGAFYFVGTVVSTIGESRRMVYCEYCSMFWLIYKSQSNSCKTALLHRTIVIEGCFLLTYCKEQGHAHDYRGAEAQSQKRAVCAKKNFQALITQYVD